MIIICIIVTAAATQGAQKATMSQSTPNSPRTLECSSTTEMPSMKHKGVPKEKCPSCLPLWGPLGNSPPIRNKTFLGPCKAPGANTKVTSARGHFCAYPMPCSPCMPGTAARSSSGTLTDACGIYIYIYICVYIYIYTHVSCIYIYIYIYTHIMTDACGSIRPTGR